jgi:prephenate dehydrogenase
LRLGQVAIIGAAGKMGTWFSSYFAQRGLAVSAYDTDQKKLSKSSSKIKVEDSLLECVQDADLVFICVPVQRMPRAIKESARNMKNGAIIAEISSVKRKTFAALKKIPNDIQPLCIHPMFGPGASKEIKPRVLLVPVRNEKIEVKIAKEIFQNANVMVLPNAKQHDKLIGMVLGLTYFANIVFARLMSLSNISMLKQASGTTFRLQSLIAESILTEEPDLVIALIAENVYAKKYIDQYLEEAAALARLVISNDSIDFRAELQKLRLDMQKKQDLRESYSRMYDMLGKER